MDNCQDIQVNERSDEMTKSAMESGNWRLLVARATEEFDGDVGI